MAGTSKGFPGYKVACRYGCKYKDGRRKAFGDENILRKHHGRTHNVWSDQNRNMEKFERCWNCLKGFDEKDRYNQHIKNIPKKCKKPDKKWKPHPTTAQEIADTYAFAKDQHRISESLKDYSDGCGGRAYMSPSGWVEENPGQASGSASASWASQATSPQEIEYSDDETGSQSEIMSTRARGDAAPHVGPSRDSSTQSADEDEFFAVRELLDQIDWEQNRNQTGVAGLEGPMMQSKTGTEMLPDVEGTGSFAILQHYDLALAPPGESQMQQELVSEVQQDAQNLPILQRHVLSWNGPVAWPQAQACGSVEIHQGATMPGHPQSPGGNFAFGLDPDVELSVSGYDGAGVQQGLQGEGQLLGFQQDDLAWLPLLPEEQAPSYAAAEEQQGAQGQDHLHIAQQNGPQYFNWASQLSIPASTSLGMPQDAQHAHDFFAHQPNGVASRAPPHQQQIQMNPFTTAQQSVLLHRNAQHQDLMSEETFALNGPEWAQEGREECAVYPQRMQQIPQAFHQQHNCQRAEITPPPVSSVSTLPTHAVQETQQGGLEPWQQQQGQRDAQLTVNFVSPLSSAPMMPTYTPQETMQQADFTIAWQRAYVQQQRQQAQAEFTAPTQQKQYDDQPWNQQSFDMQQKNHGFGTGNSNTTVPRTMRTGRLAQSAGMEWHARLAGRWRHG